MRLSTVKVIASGVLVTALVLFPADGLRALGLGEARIDSYMGQPLDVSIRLIEPDSGSLDSLTVAPAVAADYDRLGIPAAALALGLEVSVDRRVDPPLIRVRSSRQIDDPVVQILIDARWSSGRVLREYTLFLDPPTLPVAPPIRRTEPASDPVSERPARVTPAPRVDPAPESEPEPAPQARPRPAPSVSESEPEPQPVPATEPSEPEPAPVVEQPRPDRVPRTVPGVIGPVAAGQTLWGIAYGWRPNTDLTMNQVMLAILDRNPQAFIDNNVNLLRRGAELNMPSQADVESIDRAEADRRMRAQMQSWRQDSGIRDVPIIADDAIPDVERLTTTRPEDTSRSVVHRLEVVPPEGETFEQGPAVSEGEVRRVSNRLAEFEDQIATEGLESDEFDRRIDSIRDAIDTREMAGLAIADEELADLEVRLRQAREERQAAALQAEQLADQTDVGQAGAEDEISAYFRELEEELGRSEDVIADTRQDASGLVDEGFDDEGLDTDLDGVDQVDAESELTVSQPAEMPVASIRSQRGTPLWQWLLIVIVVLAVIGAAAFWWIRRSRAEPTGIRKADNDPDKARARLAAAPGDLAAHLALLKTLAAADDKDAFSDALDGMYAQVDDDEDPRWQQALNLAVTNAPDHPLLTPRETGIGGDEGDEGLDDRTREMLGILDRPQQAPESGSVDDYEIDSDIDVNDQLTDDDDFFSDDEPDQTSSSNVKAAESRYTGDQDDQEEIEGTDMDLAELSNRVDEDAQPIRPVDQIDPEEIVSAEDDAPDFAEDDEGKLSELDQPEQTSGAQDDADSLALDFAFSSDDREEPSEESDDELTAMPDAETSDAQAVSKDDIGELETDVRRSAGDTLQLDEDEIETFSKPGSRRSAGDTLPLGDDELEFDTAGDRELEAFLRSDEYGASVSDSGDGDSGDELDDDGEVTLSDEDADVKIDLARAYISMDDPDSARTLLEEIISGGSKTRRAQAKSMLDEI